MVIGVHKGGSTALYSYLVKHGSVRPAVCKEIHFFDNNDVYSKGRGYYLRHFKTLADPADHLITGEGTPNYIRIPAVPRRVMDMFPAVKLVVTLREPATRFESQWVGMVDRDMGEYKHSTCAGAWNYSVGLIERCMAQHASEAKCMADLHEDGVVRSIYLHQLERWLDVAPAAQILVIQAERLFKHTEETMQRVAAFLGIRPYTAEEIASFSDAVEGSHHLQEDKVNTCFALKKRMDDFFAPYNARLAKLLRAHFPDVDFDEHLWRA